MIRKNIAYFKDEGVKFECDDNCFDINCKMWTFRIGLKIQDTCFGYVFSKACQYVKTNEKVYKNLKKKFHQDFLLVRFVEMYNMA